MTVLPYILRCAVRWGSRGFAVWCLSLTAGAVLLGAARSAHAQCPPYSNQWGSPGNGNGQFNNPIGTATDAAGNVYVVDTNNHRIQKFGPRGAFILKWGSQGSGNGQFNQPLNVATATDSGGNIVVFVTDRFNNRVQKFNDTGGYLGQWGGLGSGNGQFNYPSGVATALDASGNVVVYVTDSDNFRIQKFTDTGAFILKWGSQGSGNGQFSDPQFIGTDPSGNVYVTDYTNHRVQMFNASGAFLLKWGSFGTSDGQFNTPAGVATDSAGDVYVADQLNQRVQKFSVTGTTSTFVCKWGSLGSGDGEFSFPVGVATNLAGHVYITDNSNARVQKFAPCVDLLCTFTPDRFSNLPPDRMQVVAMYDGDGMASLTIQLQNTAGSCCDLVIPIIDFGVKIVTLEFDMNGFEPTGEFTVTGATPNGGVDGVAFGLYSRSATGDRWLLRSRNFGPGSGGVTPDFVGGWPIAFSETQWNSLLVDINPLTCGFPPACTTCGCLNANGSPCDASDLFFARRQAQMALSGAQFLANGTWNIPTGRVCGDVNGDGCVDGSDLGLLLSCWQPNCCLP